MLRISPDTTKCTTGVQISKTTGKRLQLNNCTMFVSLIYFIRHFIDFDCQNKYNGDYVNTTTHILTVSLSLSFSLSLDEV